VLVIGRTSPSSSRISGRRIFGNTSQAYVAVSLVAFMVRVLVFHLGLLLAIVAAVSLRNTASDVCWRLRSRWCCGRWGRGVVVSAQDAAEYVRRDGRGRKRPTCSW